MNPLSPKEALYFLNLRANEASFGGHLILPTNAECVAILEHALSQPSGEVGSLSAPYCYVGIEPGGEEFKVYDADGPLRTAVWTEALIRNHRPAAAPPQSAK